MVAFRLLLADVEVVGARLRVFDFPKDDRGRLLVFADVSAKLISPGASSTRMAKRTLTQKAESD
jgi:hypothetical protein